MMKTIMVAPCGINCSICMAHLREKNKCPGCRATDKRIHHCESCFLRLCNIRKGKFCFSCEKYPCLKLRKLDERYRLKYRMSEIKNLEMIKKSGVRRFLKAEEKKWKCKKCGAILSCHKDFCLVCGEPVSVI
jgi:hypothetical protein